MSDGQRFIEGDVITFRGNEYEVAQVDSLPEGGVHQYRLEARGDSPPATLKPEWEGGETVAFVVKEFHRVENDGITVIE